MNFNRYFKNEELEEILKSWAEKYPDLVELQSIGSSYEKRPLWLLKITNQATGADTTKPAVWLDANIHAIEIAGTTVLLHLVHTLLTGYGKDKRITRILDRNAYYVVPRINPDGAALALADTPRYVRSGVRRYPWPELEEGLHEDDIDGDGRILQMRIPDPNGDWKVSTLDPRLMEKRSPIEYGGKYYRLLLEGRLEQYDGWTIKLARDPAGLDFNRNFPFEWRTEGEQSGAGPHPVSEPEIQAIVGFITGHLNINLAVTYHTFSRAILRPFSTKPDLEMETSDLWVYNRIGQIGSEITGYRNASVFHDFKYHPKEVITGGFDDWLYDHWGIFAFTIELWDLPTEAGIKDRRFMDWFRDHPHKEDLQIFKWARRNAGKAAYVDWYEFDHPQLGKVELGGWDHLFTWVNPPKKLMEAEAERNTGFGLALGELTARIEIHTLQISPLGGGEAQITLVVENSGFLPTYTSDQGKKRKAVRPVRAELELGEGVELVSGKPRVELGHLEGRSNKLDVDTLWGLSPTDNRAFCEWVVRGKPGTQITVHVRSERAGSLQRTLEIPA